ncbi:MAG: acylphosphatase [Bermanella sp.]|jgi:acylphosphatase
MLDSAVLQYMQAVKVLVKGKVQGVYFRVSAAKKAASLGLAGWVRNLDDGNVELLIQGSSSELEELLAWCEKGPVLAKVAKVYHEKADFDDKIVGFTVLK